MAVKRRKHAHKGVRKSSPVTAISHAARAALHAQGKKICNNKKASVYNKRVATCMKGKHGSPSAFKTCAKQAAGRSTPRASAPRRRKTTTRRAASSSSSGSVPDWQFRL